MFNNLKLLTPPQLKTLLSDSLREVGWVMNGFSARDIETCLYSNAWLSFYSDKGVEFNLAINHHSQNRAVRLPGYSVAVMLNFVRQELPYGAVATWRRLATALGCSASRVLVDNRVQCVSLDGIDPKTWLHLTTASIVVMSFAQSYRFEPLKGVALAGLEDTRIRSSRFKD